MQVSEDKMSKTHNSIEVSSYCNAFYQEVQASNIFIEEEKREIKM